MNKEEILRDYCNKCFFSKDCGFKIRDLKCQELEAVELGIDLAIQNFNLADKNE